MQSVSQMRDYLKIATLMETDVYTCNSLVNKLSDKINSLNSIKYYTQDDYIANSIRDIAHANEQKHLSKPAKFLIISTIICVPLSFGFIALTEGGSLIPSDWYMWLLSFGLWAIIIAAILLVKRISAKKELERKQKIYQTQLSKSDRIKKNNDIVLMNYQAQLNEAKKVYNNAIKNLNQLYCENILPQRYRNIAAVSTMYQWLRDGVCTEVYGHGGIFDKFEDYAQRGVIITNLQELNRKVDTVISQQGELINAVERGNDIAEKTYKSVCNIENTVDTMSKDIRQIKVNSHITAINTANQARMQQYMYYRSMYY